MSAATDIRIQESRSRRSWQFSPALGSASLVNVEIYQGDCLEVMPNIGQVDAVITSPPYNLGNNHHTSTKKTQCYDDAMPEDEYQQNQIEVLNAIYAICLGDVFYNHQHRFKAGKMIRPCDWIKRTQWEIAQEIVWSRGSPNMDKCRFFPFTERIYWLTKPGSATVLQNVLNLTDDWHIAPVGSNGEHTRQYPVKIPANCIASINANTILDPYLGSGTTAVACIRAGKNFVGIEKEPRFFEAASERICNELQQGVML